MKNGNMEVKYANERTKTNPVDIPRTRREHVLDVVTSLPAGKMVPLGAIELLQGDSLKSTRVSTRVMMEETADELLNGVTCKVSAYLIPNLAKERFDGSMDQLMRSYAGVAPYSGGSLIDYIELADLGTIEDGHILYYMGEHVSDASNTNSDYVEDYNILWNWRAQNRSKNLTLRTRLNTTVGPAFWNHTNFNGIVSDYDQALILGAVDIDFVNSDLQVKGLGVIGPTQATSASAKETGGNAETYAKAWQPQASGFTFLVEEDTENPGYPAIFADLATGGATMSLADIAVARRTEKFAKLRRQYSGFDEDWVIDRLMSGLEIPEQSYKQPILLDTTYGPLGTMTRYATDAANLDKKTSVGVGEFVLNIATPAVQCGGTVMIVMEILPEQIFERQMNPWLEATSVDDLPEAIRDFLDSEPVTVVPNKYIDVAHASGTDTFGFMGLNLWWNQKPTRVGGKFYRGNANPNYDQDREKLWIVETVDPTINSDWYISTEMNQSPFTYENQDPFEVQVKALGSISGLTQFGGRLLEADDEYDKVKALQDLSVNEETDVGEDS